jgi:hypothetical protein
MVYNDDIQYIIKHHTHILDKKNYDLIKKKIRKKYNA